MSAIHKLTVTQGQPATAQIPQNSKRRGLYIMNHSPYPLELRFSAHGDAFTLDSVVGQVAGRDALIFMPIAPTEPLYFRCPDSAPAGTVITVDVLEII